MFTDGIRYSPFLVPGGLQPSRSASASLAGAFGGGGKASGYRVLIALLLVAAPGCSSAPDAPQTPAEVRVLSSNGVKAVIESLQPEIERAIGHALSVEFSTAASLKTKIEAGEAFDVAVLTPALIDDLIAQGKVAADSRVDVARAGVGIGARQGTPAADVSTPDALKRTLLKARSVAFTAEGQSRVTIDRAFDRLGIAEAMRPKIMLQGAGAAPAAVAAGEAELVLTLMSEILPVPGLQLLGPFPADVQGYVTFTAGRSPNAKDAVAANALLRHLSGPAVATVLKAHGLEAVASAREGSARAVVRESRPLFHWTTAGAIARLFNHELAPLRSQ